MAYNLQSLITILEQILNSQQTRWILVDHNKPQLESLLEKAVSLQQILEKTTSLSKIQSLESQIRDAAHKAEDMIESHMVDQMLFNPSGVRFTFSTPDLQQVTQELDSIMEQVVLLHRVEENKMSSGASSSSGAATLLQTDLSSKSVVVGVDEDLMQLKDRLTGTQSKLEIIPIIGMGGIGKTPLARKLYQDPSIVSHFQYARAWITISQDYNMRAILLGLLRCIIGKEVDQHIEKKDNALKDILYKSLFGRRYIIVLDDIWSTKFWDEMRKYFPDNSKGSRIMITTRESDVAKYANSESKQHEMHLLNKSESWNLLQKVVFGEENCPAALESIGRNIASSCGGLPLAIHVTGGLLSKDNTRVDVWENVANVVRAAVSEKDDFSNILSLSYNHLPSHLRPCLLYMGAFPEDYEIKASRLIRLWVAEGFLKSTGDKSLEEEAEDSLKALVGRNLISIRALKSNGRPKRYGIHLCLKKAEEDRFVHAIKKKQVGEIEKESMYSLRRVSVHQSYSIRDIYASTEFMSLARSFLCTGLASREVLSSVFFGLRLLRVLDILEIKFLEFPTEILHICNLRYLAFSFSSEYLTCDISRLWNLQTLVIHSSLTLIYLPSEIWQMTELRHVKTNGAAIYTTWGGFIQEKLQTISQMSAGCRGFLDRNPNLRKLVTKGGLYSDDFSCLHKLETLKYSYIGERGILSPSALRLPHYLRKLSLTDFKILGEFMKYLSELPNLEVLKLQECELVGEEWDATEQVFSNLQFLLLHRLDLVHWQADESNFPRLRHLVIRCCSALKEIPCRIGEIPTLQTIELDECSPSLVTSAELIIDEQRELGNDDLQLRT